MRRADVGELYFIVPVANIESIISLGILSHTMAARVPHRSVALASVQDRREHVRVSPTRMLHDFANLYVCARNPAMYYIVNNNPIDEVCLLRISPAVFDLPGVVVTDRNAASGGMSRFDPPDAGLSLIDYDEVHAQYWTHPEDRAAAWNHSRKKCAEVLVPDRVDPALILGAYAPTVAALAVVQAAMPGWDVRMAPYPFFR